MLDIRNRWDINKSQLLFNNGSFSGTLELKVECDKVFSVTKSGKVIHKGYDREEANSVYDTELNKSNRQFS